MRIAIITGASSGLGKAYAQQLDRLGGLDELWLIARREERLKALGQKLSTPSRVLPLDLTDPTAVPVLQTLLEEERPVLDTLVCAAGFGKFGRAEDLTGAETASMIDLNCRSAAEVTRVCIPYLKRDSRVLEVASCAAFQPLQGMNVYAATKAFLLHYTRPCVPGGSRPNLWRWHGIPPTRRRCAIHLLPCGPRRWPPGPSPWPSVTGRW